MADTALVPAPAADAAKPSTSGKRDIKTLKRRLSQASQQDLLLLLAKYLLRAGHGNAHPSFSTFKATWKELGFSHIFQAFPVGMLPGAISALYDTLLAVIRDAKLPYHATKDLAAEGKGSKAQPPVLSPEDAEWVAGAAGPLVVAAAVYALYCIYHAQPKDTLTRIRVPRDYHQSVLGIAPFLHSAGVTDALILLRSLLEDGAVQPAASHRSRAGDTAAATSLPPGAGAFYITPGLRGEEAAAQREVRFHLDSTLTGLGTAHLDPLCRDYGDKLAAMWDALGTEGPGAVEGAPDGGKVPEGIADLTLGRWIHEYAVEKRKEVALVLMHGPNWASKPAVVGGGKSEGKALAPAATPAKKGRKRRGKIRGISLPKAVDEAPGIPAVSAEIEKRERAREADIARRSRPWADRAGVDYVHRTQFEDMPAIPGVVSTYEHLAGPSAAPNPTEEAAATETVAAGEKSVNDGKLGSKDSITSSSSDESSSSSSDDSSSSSSSSESESSSSGSDTDTAVVSPPAAKRARKRAKGVEVDELDDVMGLGMGSLEDLIRMADDTLAADADLNF